MGRQEQASGDWRWRLASDQRWRSVTEGCRWGMSGDIVTGGNWMAGAGWHLAVTGGGSGGLQTSGTGGDGTVGAGVVKGSDGGLQTSDDGGQQVGGDGGQHAGRSDGARAAAICHLLPLVTASRLLLSQYRPLPLIGSPLSPPVTTSSRLRHHPHGTAYHRFRLDGDRRVAYLQVV